MAQKSPPQLRQALNQLLYLFIQGIRPNHQAQAAERS
jgi:hypothetical protein